LKVYQGDSKKGIKTIDLPSNFDTNIIHTANQNKANGSVSTPTSTISKGLDRLKLSSKDNKDGSQSELKLEEKVLHCAWHPSNNAVAVAGKAGLCIYRM